MKFFVIAAAAATSIASPAMAAQLISNGSFSSGLSGWTVAPTGGNDILALTGQDYINGAGGSSSDPSNTFAAFGAGDRANVSTLSQSFNTVSGATYQYSFDVGAFGGSQTFTYKIGSNPYTTVSASGGSNLDSDFSTLTGSFVGTGAPTSVSFTLAGQPTNSVDGFIDNVSVTGAVPEPATWAMLLIGFGMIGFAMRKRSNVRTTVSYA
ncbi:PEPxxWA-CTERM sorting domain-containing protein [Novosphingobium sp.]|uniref:PEPxxWA-CTERM sorting domain-containing protein n=1 Tax=Novosphingobium sp. TaxID=1874826 RepID=UPI003B52E07D